MLRRIRIHLTPGTAIALIALVFALTGGAFAATGGGSDNHSGGLSASSHAGVLASVAKSKAKAKTGPRGPAGPAGKNGANGANGAAGAQGPQGPAGTNGTNGEKGEKGEKGPEGPAGTSVTNTPIAASQSNANCKLGGAELKVGAGTPTYACNGATGYTATLPSKATETGTWSFSTGSTEEGTQHPLASLSFPIPLKAGLDEHHVIFVSYEEMFEKAPPEACPGEFNGTFGTGDIVPKAEPGYLCVYEGFMAGGNVVHTGEAFNKYKAEAQISLPDGLQEKGASTAGALVEFTQEQGKGPSFGSGLWAVTAE